MRRLFSKSLSMIHLSLPKPISFSWSDLDKLPGGEQGGVQENVQVPNSGENAHSSVLPEKVPEERTCRYLRGNPRFMLCMPM